MVNHPNRPKQQLRFELPGRRPDSPTAAIEFTGPPKAAKTRCFFVLDDVRIAERVSGGRWLSLKRGYVVEQAGPDAPIVVTFDGRVIH
jgi:hypothetical protein